MHIHLREGESRAYHYFEKTRNHLAYAIAGFVKEDEKSSHPIGNHMLGMQIKFLMKCLFCEDDGDNSIEEKKMRKKYSVLKEPIKKYFIHIRHIGNEEIEEIGKENENISFEIISAFEREILRTYKLQKVLSQRREDFYRIFRG